VGESTVHARLRDALVAWFVDTHGADIKPYLLVDNSSLKAGNCPPSIAGYIPDVYLGIGPGRALTVGEAKTPADLETKHSRAQLMGFLSHLADHPGSRLVVAVPWYTVNQAKSLLRHLQERTNSHAVKLVILEKLSG